MLNQTLKQTFFSPITGHNSGLGTLTKSGAGALDVQTSVTVESLNLRNGDSTFTGTVSASAIEVTGGVASFKDDVALTGAAPTIAVNGGAVAEFDLTKTLSFANKSDVSLGSGDASTGTAGTLRFTGTVVATPGYSAAAAGTEIHLLGKGGIVEVSDSAAVVTLLPWIDGTGALTKAGAGTLILAGSQNTYSGVTTVAAGVLEVSGLLGYSAGAGNYAGGVDVASGATLVLNHATGTQTFAADANGDAISGSGKLVKKNANTAAFTGTVSASAIEVTGGVASFKDDVALVGATPTIAVNGGAVAEFDITKTLSFANKSDVSLGSGDASTGTAGTLRFTGAGAKTPGQSSAAAGTEIHLLGKGGIVEVTDSTAVVTLLPWIDGAGALTKAGAGTLVLAGSQNTYTGKTYLAAGALSIEQVGNLGTGGLSFSGAGATVNALEITAATGLVDIAARGAVSVADGSTGNEINVVNAAATANLGNVAGNAATRFTNTGAGLVQIGNFAGTVQGGKWSVAAAATLGAVGTSVSELSIHGATTGAVSITQFAQMDNLTLNVRFAGSAADRYDINTGASTIADGNILSLTGFTFATANAHTVVTSAAGFLDSAAARFADGTNLLASGGQFTALFGGAALTDRQGAKLIVQDGSGADQSLVLKTYLNNLSLYWNGASGVAGSDNVWKNSGQNNWGVSATAAQNTHGFVAGDIVNFASAALAASGNNAVSVAEDVTVGAMNITNGAFTFAGTATSTTIKGDAASTEADSDLAATGLLKISGAGASADFAVNLDFAGYEIADGATATFRQTVKIGAGNVKVSNGATAILDTASIITAAAPITLALDSGTLKFTSAAATPAPYFLGGAAAGQNTLSVSGTSNIVVDAATLAVTLRDAITNPSGASTLNVSGAGTLVFEHNVAVTTLNISHGTAQLAASQYRDGTSPITFAGNAINVTDGGTARMHQNSQIHLTAGGSLSLDAGTLEILNSDLATPNSFTIAAGSAAGATVRLGLGGGTISIAGNLTATLPAWISGAGALTKAGAGTLVLDGTQNTHTGATTVAAGALKVSGLLGYSAGTGTGNYAGAIAVGAGATLEFSQASNQKLTGNITAHNGGHGALVQSGAGTLEIQGNVAANTVAVSNGTAVFGDKDALTGKTVELRKQGATDSSITVAPGASGQTAVAQMWSNTELKFVDAGAITLGSAQGAGALQFLNHTPGAAQSIIPGSTGAGGVTLALAGQGGIVGVDSALTVTLLPWIDGAGALTKAGAGTLILAGTQNTYSGATTVAAGTLEVSGLLGYSAGAGNYAGAIAIGAGAELVLNQTLNQKFTGAITGYNSGFGTLTKSGAGALTAQGSVTVESLNLRNGDSTFTGTVSANAIEVTGGVASFKDDVALVGAAPTIAVNGGAVAEFDLNKTLSFAAKSDVSLGSGDASTGTAGTLRFTGTVAATPGLSAAAAGTEIHLLGKGGIVEVTDSAAVVTLLPWIDGAGALTKAGAGTLILAGSQNTYSGKTYLAAGALSIEQAGNLGTGGLSFSGAGATVNALEITAANGLVDLAARGAVSVADGSTGNEIKVVNAAATANLGNIAAAASAATLLTNTGAGLVQIGNFAGTVQGGKWSVATGATLGGVADEVSELSIHGAATAAGTANLGVVALPTSGLTLHTTLGSAPSTFAGYSAADLYNATSLENGALEELTFDVGAFRAGKYVLLTSGATLAGDPTQVALAAFTGGNSRSASKFTLADLDSGVAGADALILQLYSKNKELTWIGGAAAGANRWDGAGALVNWSGTSSTPANEAFLDGDVVTFDTNGTQTTLDVAANVLVGAASVSGKNYTFTGAGSITGRAATAATLGAEDILAQANGSLGVTDATATFENAGVFFEEVSVTDGTLAISDKTAFGITKEQGKITLEDSTLSFVNRSGVSGKTLDLGANSANGVSVHIVGTATVAVDAGLHANLAAWILEDATGANFTKDGAGTLTLSGGGNNHTGVTTVAAGTLALFGQGSLAASSKVAVTAGATFDISAAASAASIKALGGAGAVTLGSNTLNLTASSGAFSGGFAGAGKVHLASGTLELSGASSHTGGFVTAAGTTLTLASSGALGAASGNLANAGTVTFKDVSDFDTAYTLANAVSGTGTVNWNGTGTLTLGSAAYTAGTTNVNAGALKLAGNITSKVALAGGTTLDFNGANITGSITAGFAGGTGATFLGAGSITGDLALDGASITPVFGSHIAVTGGVTLSGNDTAFAISKDFADQVAATAGNSQVVLGWGGSLTDGGKAFIADLASDVDSAKRAELLAQANSVLFKFGHAKTLTWNGAVGLTDALTWDSGRTSATNWLAGVTAERFYNGDTVIFDDTAENTAVVLADGANFVVAGISMTSGDYDFSVAGGGTATISGAVFDKSGSGGLLFSGGNLTLADGLNIADGAVGVKGATLNVGAATNIRSGAALAIDAGGTFTGTTLNVTGGGVSVADGGALSTSGAVTVSGSTVAVADGSFNAGSAVTLTDSEVLVSDGFFNAGSTVSLTDGSIKVVSDGSFNAAGAVTLTGSTVEVADGTFTAGSTVSLTSGSIKVATDGSFNAAGAVAANGNIILNGGSLTADSLVLGSAGVLQITDEAAKVTLNNAITGNTVLGSGTVSFALGAGKTYALDAAAPGKSFAIGGGNAVEINSGTVTFGRTNSYTGGTAIKADATLVATSRDSLGTGDITVATAGALTLKDVRALGAASHLANAGTLNLEFGSTAYTLANAVSGTGTVNWNGTGTLSLGSAAYSAAETFLKDGSLTLAGDITTKLTSAFTAGAHSVNLAGKRVSGDVSIAKGGASGVTLTGPGSVAGKLTLNSVTVETPATGVIAMTGTLALAGANVIRLTDAFLANYSSGEHNLLTYATSTFTDPAKFTLDRGNFSTAKRAVVTTDASRTYVELDARRSLFWSGAASLDWNSGSTSALNWASGNTAERFYQNDRVTFADATEGSIAVASSTVNLSGDYTVETILVNTTSGYTFSGVGDAKISGAPLIKQGVGLLSVSDLELTLASGLHLNGGTVFVADGAKLVAASLAFAPGSASALKVSGEFNTPGLVALGTGNTLEIADADAVVAVGSDTIYGDGRVKFSADYTPSFVIGGTNKVEVAASVTLARANTYTGGTTVLAGKTLSTGNENAFGSGAVSLADNTAILNLSGANFRLTNDVTGFGTVNWNGTGTLTLGSASYTADTTNVNKGTLKLAGDITSKVVLAGGATLNFNGANITGNVTAAHAASGATFLGAGSIVGDLALDGATIYPVAGSHIAATGSVTFGTNKTIFQITPAFLATLQPGGQVVLSCGSLGGATPGTKFDYNLDAAIDAARRAELTVLNNKDILFNYGASKTLVWNGTTTEKVWDIATTTANGSKNWTENGTGNIERFFAGDTVLFNDAAAEKNVNLATAAYRVGGITVSNSAGKDYTFTATADVVITGASFVKTGAGLLTFKDKSFTLDGLEITGGKVTAESTKITVATSARIGGSGAAELSLPAGAEFASAAPVLVGDSGRLALTGGKFSAPSASLASSGVFAIEPTGDSKDFAGNLDGSGAVEINASADFTPKFHINGANSLRVLGVKTVTLDAAQTYAGGTAIVAGAALKASAAGALGTGNVENRGTLSLLDKGALAASASVANFGDLNLEFDAADYVPGGSISGTGKVNWKGTGTLTLGGAGYSASVTTFAAGAGTLKLAGLVQSGEVTLGAGVTLTGAGSILGKLAFAGAGAYAFTSPVSVTGTVSLGGDVTVSVPNAATFFAGRAAGATEQLMSYGGLAGGSGAFKWDAAATTAIGSQTYRVSLISAATSLYAEFGKRLSLEWNGGANGTWNKGASSTANWKDGATAERFFDNDSVSFGDLGIAASAVTFGETAYTVGGIAITSDTTNYSFGGTTTISGAPLVKTGSATATIASGTLTLANGLHLNGGTLAVASGAKLTASGALTVSGSTLNLAGEFASDKTLSLGFGSALEISGNAAKLNVAGNTVSGSGVVRFNTAAYTPAFLIGGGNSVEIASGKTTFNTANTYTGGTTIAPGAELILGASGKLGKGDAVVHGTLNLAAAAGALGLDATSVIRNSGTVQLPTAAGAFGTAISGGAVTWAGTGETQLGSAAYSVASTTFSTGSLKLAGNIASGALSVAGAIDLNGKRITGSVTKVGTLKGAGSILGDLALNGSTFDHTGLVSVDGTLSLAGENSVHVGATFFDAKGVKTLMTFASRSGAGGFKWDSTLTLPTDSRVVLKTTDTALVAELGLAAKLFWSGAESGVWDVGVSENWKNEGGEADKFFAKDSVVFDDTAATTAVAFPASATVAGLSVANATKTYTFTGAGVVSGAALEKTGAATLRIGNGGASDLKFTDGIRLLGGNLNVLASATLRTDTASINSANMTVAANAHFLASGAVTVSSGKLALAGEFGAASLNLGGSGVFEITGTSAAVTLPGGVSGNGLVKFSTSHAPAFAISGGNSVEVAGGTVTISGVNSHTGGTLVSGAAATLNVTGSGSLGTGGIENRGTLTLADTASFDGAFVNGAGATASFSGVSTHGSGRVSNSGAITVSDNACLGTGVIVNAGVLNIHGANAFGAGATITNSGTLNLASSLGSFSLQNAVSGAGTVTYTAGTADDTLTLGSKPFTASQTLITGGSLTLAGVVTTNIQFESDGTLDLARKSVSGDIVLAGGSTLTGGGSVSGDLAFAGGNILDFGGRVFHVAGGVSVATGTVTVGDTDFLAGLSKGTYTLLDYGFKAYADGSFVLPDSLALGYRAKLLEGNNALQLQLGQVANLVWDGATGTGWKNNETLFAGDSVTFDDTATSTVVALPASQGGISTVTLANETRDYTFTGDSEITANSVAKTGAGLVNIGSASGDVPSTLALNSAFTASAGTVSVNPGSAAAVSGTAAFNGDSVLRLNGGSFAAGALALGSGATLEFTSDASTLTAPAITSGTVSFDIGESGSLSQGAAFPTLAGSAKVRALSGTVSLLGGNTHTGGVSIASGATVKASDATAFGGGAISNQGTLALTSAGSFTLDNAVSGNGLVTFSGAELKLGSAPYAAGETRVLSGVLSIAGAVGGDVSLAAGVNLSGTGSISGDLALAGGGIFVPNARALSVDGFLVLDGSTLVEIPAALLASAVGGAAGSVNLLTYEGLDAGTGGFVLGSLPAAYEDIRLSLGLGANALTLDVNGIFDLVWNGTPGASAWEVNGALNWLRDGTATAARFLQKDSVLFNDAAASKSVALDGVYTVGGFRVASAAAYIFTGEATVIGAALVKEGSGTLLLDGAQLAVPGGLEIREGTLKLDNGATFSAGDRDAPKPLALSGAHLAIAAGSTLNYSGAIRAGTGATAASITLDGGHLVAKSVEIGSLGSLSGSGDIAGNLTISGGAVTVGAATGSAAETLATTGALAFSGASTLNLDLFALSTADSLTALGAVSAASGATIQLNLNGLIEGEFALLKGGSFAGFDSLGTLLSARAGGAPLASLTGFETSFHFAKGGTELLLSVAAIEPYPTDYLRVWNTGSGSWNRADTNWLDSKGVASAFASRTVVQFEGVAGESRVVTIDDPAGHVRTGSVYITGDGDYLFTGGGIRAEYQAVAHPRATGALTKSGLGATTFKGISTAFEGGAFINAGTLVLDGAELDANTTVGVNGRLTLGAAGTTGTVYGSVINNGTLNGNGKIKGALTNNGLLDIGFSPGTLEINGAFDNSHGTIKADAATDAGGSPVFDKIVYNHDADSVLSGNLAFDVSQSFLATGSRVLRLLVDNVNTGTLRLASEAGGGDTLNVSVLTPGLRVRGGGSASDDHAGYDFLLAREYTGLVGDVSDRFARGGFGEALDEFGSAGRTPELDEVVWHGGARASKEIRRYSPLGLASLTAMPVTTANAATAALRDRLDGLRLAGKSVAATGSAIPSAYFMAAGGVVKNGSESTSPVFDMNFGGGTVGFDYAFANGVILGAGATGNTGRATIHDGGGRVSSNQLHIAAYASVPVAELFDVTASIHGGASEFDIRRHTIGGTNTADTRGSDSGASLYASKAFSLSAEHGLSFKPCAGFDYVRATANDFTEDASSASSGALDVRSFSQNSLRAKIGADFEWTPAWNVLPTRFTLSLGYARELLDNEVDINAKFARFDGRRFNVDAASTPRDILSIGPSAEISIGKKASISAGYTFETDLRDQTAHTLNATFRYRF